MKTGDLKFSGEAFDNLKEFDSRFAEKLRVEALAVASRHNATTVLPEHVREALTAVLKQLSELLEKKERRASH